MKKADDFLGGNVLLQRQVAVWLWIHAVPVWKPFSNVLSSDEYQRFESLTYAIKMIKDKKKEAQLQVNNLNTDGISCDSFPLSGRKYKITTPLQN